MIGHKYSSNNISFIWKQAGFRDNPACFFVFSHGHTGYARMFAQLGGFDLVSLFSSL